MDDPAKYVPSAEEIKQQRELLTAHRQTLAIYLKQKALHSEAHTPPSVIHGIDSAREAIRKVKTTLQKWNVTVDDHPDDDEPPDVLRLRQIRRFGFIAVIVVLVGLGVFVINRSWSYITDQVRAESRLATATPSLEAVPGRTAPVLQEVRPSETATIIPETTPTASPTPTLEPPLCQVIVATLNVRPGPGVGYGSPMSQLVEGDRLTPIARSRDPESKPWLQVNIQGQNITGWVSAGQQYVSCNNIEGIPDVPPPPLPTATPTQLPTVVPTVDIPISGCILTIDNPLVSLQREPESFSMQIIRVKRGQYEALDYIETTFGQDTIGWFKIDVDGRIGWIRNDTWTIAGKTDACP